MAELVQPQLGHRIADPACGAGNFLFGAYQYIITGLAKIVARYHARTEMDTERTYQAFMVPRKEIEEKDFSLSFSSYKEDVFEEMAYEEPSVILDRLIAAEVRDMK